jgi:UDP-N-acetylmuramoyl-tripeptide--D-alanyl-D-alanine ligase
MPPERIAEALATACPPEMRLQRLVCGRLTVLNDAYNANPTSVAAALRTLADMGVAPAGRRVAVLADMLELGPQSQDLHAETGRLLARMGCIDCLVAVGPQARHLADAAVAETPKLTAHRFGDVAEAAARIRELLRPGDVVLLKGSRGMRLEQLIAAINKLEPNARYT